MPAYNSVYGMTPISGKHPLLFDQAYIGSNTSPFSSPSDSSSPPSNNSNSNNNNQNNNIPLESVIMIMKNTASPNGGIQTPTRNRLNINNNNNGPKVLPVQKLYIASNGNGISSNNTALSSPITEVKPEDTKSLVKLLYQKFLLLRQILSFLPNQKWVVLAILKKVLVQTDGKDKALKLVQYGCKLALQLAILPVPAKGNSSQRVQSLVSHLSLARKIVRLGHFIETAAEIPPIGTRVKDWSDALERIAGYVGVLNDLADDVYCMSKLGLIQDKAIAARAETISAQAWMLGIGLDIREQMQNLFSLNRKVHALEMELMPSEKKEDSAVGPPRVSIPKEKELELEKLKSKRFMTYVTLSKLFADFIFCSYDVFHIEKRPEIQTFAGFVAAVISSYKLVVKAMA